MNPHPDPLPLRGRGNHTHEIDLSFTLNGRPVTVRAPSAMRLLDLLRERFRLTGSKEGCGEGECGACTVLMDGRQVNSCLVAAAASAVPVATTRRTEPRW